MFSQLFCNLHKTSMCNDEIKPNKNSIGRERLISKWLSEQIGKSFSTTNAYCCNRQQPNLETLYKIAQLLSVELKELIVDGTIEKK